MMDTVLLVVMVCIFGFNGWQLYGISKLLRVKSVEEDENEVSSFRKKKKFENHIHKRVKEARKEGGH